MPHTETNNLGLCLGILQANIIWESPSKNLAQYDKILEEQPADFKPDVLILPEMFTTGFSMNAQYLAEPTEGKTLEWMRYWAKRLNCVVTGSCIIYEQLLGKDDKKYYNRAFWVESDGRYQYYDKRHLFRMGGEHDVYTAGKHQFCVEWRNWKIGLMVCYDLRFPVWARRHEQFDYDCLIYVANWPTARIYAWHHLLVARAIENQSYVVGVNRLGYDPNQIAYNGHSLVIDYRGNIISRLCNEEHKTELHTVILPKDDLYNFRQQFPAWADADSFSILT